MIAVFIAILGSSVLAVATHFAFLLSVRKYLRTFPPERWGGKVLSPKTKIFARWGSVLGPFLVFFAFLWLLVAFNYVQNTVQGAWILFAPSFASLFLGAGLGLFSELVWFWSAEQ